MEEGQKPETTGEPVGERARIAGVEAGVAAGLVPSSEALARPSVASELAPVDGVAGAAEASEGSGGVPAVGSLAAYDLPDWTDPPTLQVPQVFIDLEQTAAAERVGPPPPPPGGPVWRERQEDWDDTDTALANLASAGPSVTDYEVSSSDDPFAYDFLDFDDESSWISEEERTEAAKAVSRNLAGSSPPRETPVVEKALPKEPAGAHIEPTEALEVVPAGEDASPARETRRRHRARRGRSSLNQRPTSEAAPKQALGLAERAERLSRPKSRPAAAVRNGPERASSSARDPVVATITGLALAGLLLACFKAGPPAVLALAAVAVTLATAEIFGSLRIAGYSPATLLGLLAVPGVMVAAYFKGPGAIPAVLAGFVVLATVWYLAGITHRSPVAGLSVTVLAVAWTGLLGSFAGLLLDPRIFPDRHGLAFLLGAVIAAVGYDIGGYAIGSRLGRHPMAPSVSPNKTWEGLIGGCVLAIGASAGITSQIHPWHLTTALVLGVIVAVVAPCGDLVESMIKRDLGVKDMGSLLPGHGGVMDRIDALLFVLPAAYYFIRLAHI